LDPLVTIGADGRIMDVNVATEAATGRSRTELIGTDFSSYFTDPEKARIGYERAFSAGVIRDYPLELRHCSGSTACVLYNASVYRDVRGQVMGVFAAARDVTALKRTEAALQHANRALRATSGCNQAIVHARKESDLLQDVCRVIVEDAGYRMAWIGIPQHDDAKTVLPVASAGQEAGYLHSGHFTWGDNEYGRGPTGTAIRTGEPSICRDMLRDPRFAPWREQAIQRGYASSMVLPLIVDGRVIAAVSIYATEPDAFDTSEAKWLSELAEDVAYGIHSIRLREQQQQSETALRRANAYNRSLLEANLDPLVTIGADGKIMDVNGATEAATGCNRSELIGTDFSDYFTDPAQAKKGYLQVFRDGQVRDFPLDLRHRSGRVISVLYNASVYRDENGHTQGVFAAARDITDRRRAEEHIRRYAAELQRSNQELERFAYVASHDLQEPLRSVSSFSELLAHRYQGRLGHDADDFIGFIVGGAKRMQTLINDLLAFSRVGTRGKPFTPVDLERALAAATENLTASIQETSTQITHEALPTVMADPVQIVQLLQNLIGNAIKFCRPDNPPHIAVEARQLEEAWEIRIRDNGIGIEPQYFDRIFIIFQRLHALDQYPGTGIGLAICKKIVERHGGRIRVESQPGQGSTFTFTLPFSPPSTS
jgi:PAS domain S-box-containing protein